MIAVGICVLHLHSSIVFKVFRMDSNFITLIPYMESSQKWDRENIVLMPSQSIRKLTETHCPREGGN